MIRLAISSLDWSVLMTMLLRLELPRDAVDDLAVASLAFSPLLRSLAAGAVDDTGNGVFGFGCSTTEAGMICFVAVLFGDLSTGCNGFFDAVACVCFSVLACRFPLLLLLLLLFNGFSFGELIVAADGELEVLLGL
jgi:hypothetical protein